MSPPFDNILCVLLWLHVAEKMGFGIAISMAIQMLLTVLGAGASEEAQRQRQQQLEMERMRRGYHRTHSARWVGWRDREGGVLWLFGSRLSSLLSARLSGLLTTVNERVSPVSCP